MGLPKIDVPVYDMTVPSTGKVIKVRPFSVKEEKILFMALESKDMDSIITTVKQIINNCIVEGELDVDRAPFFDIDYAFIFLRAKSVGPSVEVNLTCNNVLESGDKCGNIFETSMDIANCDIMKDEEINPEIDLGKGSGIKMKYPNYAVIKRIESSEAIDKKTTMIVNSVDYIWDKKGQYSSKDYSKDELKDFVEGLTEENYKKLEKFIDHLPVFVVKMDATCTRCGFEHHVRYSDFYDFFF
jgi:hypothetical protein